MARRIGLSAMGMGRLIVFAGAAIVYGAHQLAVKVGLAEQAAPHRTFASAPPSTDQSLSERDAEVKRMIAARAARAKAIKSDEGQ